MRTDYYRSWEPLFAPTDLAVGPLLLLTPHPDDEVLGAGGLVLGHRDRGCRVDCVVMTDGRLGDVSGRYGDGYVDVRKEECRRASAALGGTELTFLDFPDFGLKDAMAADDPAPAARVREILEQGGHATVAFPSPYELHPDHRATAIAALMAVRDAGAGVHLMAYEVGSFMPNNLLIDITATFGRKLAALECYASQIEHHDLPGKMTGLNVARTANVDDKAVTHCEAYLRIEAARAADFLAATEAALRLTDSMAPPVPYA